MVVEQASPRAPKSADSIDGAMMAGGDMLKRRGDWVQEDTVADESVVLILRSVQLSTALSRKGFFVDILLTYGGVSKPSAFAGWKLSPVPARGTSQGEISQHSFWG